MNFVSASSSPAWRLNGLETLSNPQPNHDAIPTERKERALTQGPIPERKRREWEMCARIATEESAPPILPEAAGRATIPLSAPTNQPRRRAKE